MPRPGAIDRLVAGGVSRERCEELSAWLAVPLLLALLQFAASVARRPASEHLLVPPMAVIAYVLFKSPASAQSGVRGAVLVPVIGAVTGEVASRLFGMTPWGVAAAVLLVLGAQRLLGVTMPPALALALLALMLRLRGPYYALDVLVGTSAIAGAFFAWRRWLWSRLPPAAALRK